MSRRALVIGINCYHGESPMGEIPDLTNAVKDAQDMSVLLDKHDSEDDNYGVETFLVDDHDTSLSTSELYDKINRLFEGSYASVVFYFAGHGYRDPFTDRDYLITTDGTFPNYGVPLDYIVNLANNAYPRIHNTTIILDCCHAAGMGENKLFADGSSIVGKGVTILAGCGADEGAADGLEGENGLFTGLLLDGLRGNASDLFGRVTPASLYNLVDQRLSSIQQRPVYKANVSDFVVLRLAKEKFSRAKIRSILKYFPTLGHVYTLSPECEPAQDRGHLSKIHTEEAVPFDKDKHKIYRLMQTAVAEGLVKPTAPDEQPDYWEEDWPPNNDGSFAMWHAAIFSGGCKLTNYGQHFWKLNKDGNL